MTDRMLPIVYNHKEDSKLRLHVYEVEYEDFITREVYVKDDGHTIAHRIFTEGNKFAQFLDDHNFKRAEA